MHHCHILNHSRRSRTWRLRRTNWKWDQILWEREYHDTLHGVLRIFFFFFLLHQQQQHEVCETISWMCVRVCVHVDVRWSKDSKNLRLLARFLAMGRRGSHEMVDVFPRSDWTGKRWGDWESTSYEAFRNGVSPELLLASERFKRRKKDARHYEGGWGIGDEREREI